MASKGPKKKESKDNVGPGKNDLGQGSGIVHTDEKTSTKKKAPIPLWPEWSDQEIANEKWDLAKKEKERGRSPNAAQHYFEDPEGLIDMPLSLKAKIHSWKRPTDIIEDDIIPVVVKSSRVHDSHLDILEINEHITSSEVMNSIIASITTLYQFFTPTLEVPSSSYSKFKPNIIPKETTKDSKADKNNSKKDGNEAIEETSWKPWDLIWPKENAKGVNSLPVISPSGKYVVKLYWMGAFRKIVIDDTIPCDLEMKPLLPFTPSGHELWLLLLSKALIKVASLDYFGGKEGSEMGEASFVHCLTGWIPEQIPLEKVYSDRVWNLLLNVLPNWKLPTPPPPPNDNSITDMKNLNIPQNQPETVSKQELSVKESKDKNKKDEKTKEDKKAKVPDKSEPKTIGKDKLGTPSIPSRQDKTPEYLLFASFGGAPLDPFQRFADVKREASASVKLRQFGLSRCLPHPVHVSVVRNCPLIPPPTPVQIPRWKLIRQKKKKETSEPSLHPKEIKEPKFVELKTPFLNFNISPTPVPSIHMTGSKFDKFKSSMTSVGEESGDGETNDDLPEAHPATPSSASGISKVDEDNQSKQKHPTSASRTGGTSSNVDGREERTLSFDSQTSVAVSSITGPATPKSPKTSKSRNAVTSKDTKKSILKERKSNNNSNNDEPPISTESSSDKTTTVLPDNSTTDDPSGAELGGVDQEDASMCCDETKLEKEQQKDFWMELDDFFECFSTLWIYHKPKTHCKNIIDTRIFEKSERGKKSSGHNLGSTGRSALLSPTSCLNGGNAMSDAPPPYLLVDCLKETEVLITLQSFSRWFDPNINVNCIKDGRPDKEYLRSVATPLPGSLVVEPYSWKRIASSSPMLKIRTTGIKAVTLTLPPGRHVLRLMITAPLGYNVHVSSCHPFVFGDENSIMPDLTNESLRFIDHGVDVLRQLMNIAQYLMLPSNITTNINHLIIGTENKSYETRLEHFEALFKSLARILKKQMGTNYQVLAPFTMEVWKYKARFFLVKHNKRISKNKRPSSSPTPFLMKKIRGGHRSSLPAIHFDFDPTDTFEKRAAIKIQACFKGFYTMKLNKACTPGTAENTNVVEQLTKIYQHLETNTEAIAVAAYRCMFTEQPSLFQCFPFYTDEWNKISYADYTGNYPEQPADSWFVLYRDIFHVEETFLILPKFYCNVPGCHLIVVDNDKFKEVKTVFKRVVPQVLKKNKSGYTFVAIAYSDSITPAGKFKLRVIGERDPLPVPTKDGNNITSNFFCNDIRDYYVPNRYFQIFRYSVTTTEDALSSIHFSTSKDDVYVRLQILDDEEILFESEGKKNVTVPSFLFYKDQNGEDRKPSRPTSRTGSGRSSGKASQQNRRPLSSKKSASPEKSKSKLIENKVPESIEEIKTHKYVIQGFVLKKSWPLTKKQWDFVEALKNTEEEEVPTEVPTKPENNGKNSAGKTRSKGGNTKDAKGNRSRPESQAQNLFDTSQPHWNLKVFLDSHLENVVEIKRDTERADEIKSIKKAWETHEPGRSAKALEAREKYLQSHTVTPLVDESKEIDEGNESEGGLETNDDIKEEDKEEIKQEPDKERTTSTTPTLSEADSDELYVERPPKDTDIVLKQFDATPFIRSTGKPVFLDANKEEELRSELEKRFQEYHEVREMVLNLREEDRLERNTAKEQQIQQYEQMQVELDTLREKVYKERGEYRKKFLPKLEVEITDVDGKKDKRTPSPKRKPSKIGKTPSKVKKK